MYSLSIQVDDQVSLQLRAIDVGVELAALAPIAGESGKQVVVNHLLGLSAARHRSDSTGDFYGEAAAATNYQPSGDGLVISINKAGIAQRYFGGRIDPVNVSRLAIPARTESRGKRPREFSNLEVVFFRETMALVERQSTDLRIVKDRRKGREGQLRAQRGQERGSLVMFWLVPFVDQQPDPEVLPDESAIMGAVYARIEQHIARLEDRRAA